VSKAIGKQKGPEIGAASKKAWSLMLKTTPLDVDFYYILSYVKKDTGV
jgi:hypothetical protein